MPEKEPKPPERRLKGALFAALGLGVLALVAQCGPWEDQATGAEPGIISQLTPDGSKLQMRHLP